MPQSPPAPLTRIARPPPWRPRRLVGPIVGTMLVIKLATGSTVEPDCRVASATATAEIAAEVCERAYLHGGDPAIGVRLADAQRRSGHHAVAGALANGLLATSARADALRVIGMIAAAGHQVATARRALEAARDLHREEARHAEAAQDEQDLADLLAATPAGERPPIESPVQM